MNSAPKMGFVGLDGKRTGYSQFNLMLNLLLHERPSGYAFHATPKRSGSGYSVQPGLPAPQVASHTLPRNGYSLEALTKLRTKHPDAVFSDQPLFSSGANSAPYQWLPPAVEGHCYGRYPSLGWTVNASVRTILASKTWSGAGKCYPWREGAHDVIECVTRYLEAARAAVESSAPERRAAGLHACERPLSLRSKYAMKELSDNFLAGAEGAEQTPPISSGDRGKVQLSRP